MKKKIIPSTPSQTVGPFYGNYINFSKKKFPFKNNSSLEKTTNSIIRCKIKNKLNLILEDCFIEYWQVRDNNGEETFFNFNRVKFSYKEKCFLLNIYKNKYLTNIYTIIFGRGILNPLYSKIYLEDDLPIYKDYIYNRIPKKRLKSITAKSKNHKKKLYEFDFYLNGPKETVFFNIFDESIYE